MKPDQTPARQRSDEPLIAVTGLGAVSAWGWDADALWNGLVSGEAAIGEPDRFDTAGHRTHLASEVSEAPNDDAHRELVASAAWRRASRADRFALVAALEAWRAAGWEVDGVASRDEHAERNERDERIVGVFFGGSTAGMAEGEDFYVDLVRPDETAPRRPRVAPLASHQINGPGDAVARYFRVTGRVESLSSACASGGLAIGAALDALRRGEVDVAITGGADSLCHLTYAGFNSLRAVDAERCSPFRSGRAGLNLGEGAGVLILEREVDARQRGRRPLARVLGHGASCDAHHMTAPHPQGVGATRAIRAALRDAGVEPGAVTFVNTHGTGTPLNDRAEGKALGAVFGSRVGRLPITSTKGAIGHLLGSSGAIEAVATILGLHHGLVHPTPGRGSEVDPEIEVDLVVGAARPFAGAGAAALSTSFAFGGSNAAVIFGSADSTP